MRYKWVNQILGRKPDVVLINKMKRTCYLYNLPFQLVKIKESQKTGQIPRCCKRAEKMMEHEGDSDINHSWSSWNCPQKTGKDTE